MQGNFTVHQPHGGDQSNKSEIMVAMQMADENVLDTTSSDFVPAQLHLSALSTVDQEKLVIPMQHLGRWMAVEGGNGRVVAQDGKAVHMLTRSWLAVSVFKSANNLGGELAANQCNRHSVIKTVQQFPFDFLHLHNIPCLAKGRSNV